MVRLDHPTFAPDWLGAWGHVEGETPPVSGGYPHRVLLVRIGGQIGEVSDGVRERLGETMGISEAVLIHPD